MAFHVELFSSSIASGANTFAQVTYFTPDNLLPKLVNGVQVSPMLPYLGFIAGVGANLVHVRAQAPSLLPFPYVTLGPNNRGTAFESPARVFDFYNNPIPLNVTEEFDIFATQNAGAGQTEYVLAGFCGSKPTALPVAINPPALATQPRTAGRFFTLHGTASTTLTAGQWTLIQPTLDQALPAGYYYLIGMRAFSATALFFRIFPAIEPLWRPGGVAVQAYDQLDPPGQRATPFLGNILAPWGVWLGFYQNVVPQVEIFATAADTAEEFWFDLVYAGPQTSTPQMAQ